MVSIFSLLTFVLRELRMLILIEILAVFIVKRELSQEEAIELELSGPLSATRLALLYSFPAFIIIWLASADSAYRLIVLSRGSGRHLRTAHRTAARRVPRLGAFLDGG